MSNQNDSDSDLPELEAPYETTKNVYIDKNKLPLGDPVKEFDDSKLEQAMTKRAKSLQIFKDNLNEALLLISDSIEMFPNSAMYLNTRAEIFRYNGDVQLALRDLRLAQKRNQQNTPFKTYKLLAELLFDSQDFNECVVSCRNALKLENDESIQQLLQEALLREKQQEAQQKQFEIEQKEKQTQQKQNKQQEKTLNSDIQDEIKKKYGDNPVYQSDLFQNLFGTAQGMTDQKANQLMNNPMLMAAFQDPNFAKNIAELAKNPQAGQKLMQDENFARNFQNVLGAFK